MRRPSRALVPLAIIALLAWGGAWLSSPGTASEAFVVREGDHAGEVTDRLKDAGIVRSGTLFRLALARTGAATKLKPGAYDLSVAESYADIARMLAAGPGSSPEVTVRILEGWDLYQIADHLEAKGLPGRDAFFAVTGVPGVDASNDPSVAAADLSGRYAFLADKPIGASLEGYLFPDTYRVFPDATVGDVLDAMLGNFDAKLTPELRAAIAASGRTVFETVTMASIVEREVRGEEDMRRVADLFWRRLDVGMALQADSTVNYVTRKGLPSVTYEDLEVDSRYNTYKYPGLPFGPIGNPGLQALRAVIDPLPNDAWYFLTDPEGTVYYAATFDQHIVNKNRHLR
jgi:UPF0755 protein